MAKCKYQKWFEPDNLILLKGWARDGLTDEQIAKNIGVSRSTLKEWKKNHPAISATLSGGKEVIDYEVESAVCKKSIGYDYWEEVEEWDRETGQWIPVKRTKKHVPPDIGAAKMWLGNRSPEKWKEHPVPVEVAEVVDDGFIEALNGSVESDWGDYSG